jgi:hypothetical protein
MREVRDRYLLSNVLGTTFVDAYYRVSPHITDVVARSPLLAAIIHLALIPLRLAAQLMLSE